MDQKNQRQGNKQDRRSSTSSRSLRGKKKGYNVDDDYYRDEVNVVVTLTPATHMPIKWCGWIDGESKNIPSDAGI